MRIMVLDKDFEILGTIGIFNSFIWDRRYYEPGVFEMHAAVDYFPLMDKGKYLYRNDRTDLAVIEEVEYRQGDKGERSSYCKGHFAEILLNRRVAMPLFDCTGRPGTIGQSAITKYFINPDVSDREFANIKLGELNTEGESLNVQSTGDLIGEKLYEIEKTQEMSHRLRFDYLDNSLYFETWKGLDRRDSQSVNSWAVFSNSFYNIKNVSYNRNDAEYKNFAYVQGEGEGSARVTITVDIRQDPTEQRREVYVDARDLQKTYTDDGGTQHTLTQNEYEERLRQRGIEKLTDYLKIETVNSDVDPNANLIYRQDFDLGDLCTYKNVDIDLETEKRITQIQEVYEGASHILNITFGEDEATSIKKIIKREAS